MSASPLTIGEAQMHAAEMGWRAAPPEQYRWRALWWHLESKRRYPSAAASLQYSRNLLDLRRDMLARPEHYAKKRTDLTDWQWMQNRA
jgi:hypothetical protein